jgi:diadenylate cyclase
MRHRAAIGMSEKTDAVIVIISEETGFISYCENGEIKYNISSAELRKLLLEKR